MIQSQLDPSDPWYQAPIRAGARIMPDYPYAPPALRSQLMQNFTANNAMTGTADAYSGHSPGINMPTSMMTPEQRGNAWPTYSDEATRNLAIDMGQYDPNFATPRAKMLYEGGTQANYANANAMQAAQVASAQTAYANDDSPANLRRMQLAGDRTGAAKRVLQSLQPVQTPYAPVEPGSIGGAEELKPYNPDNYGGSPTQADGLNPRLDKVVVGNPEFQKMLKTDPKKAAFVYQRLTGRAYEGDVEAYSSLQKATGKADFDFVQRQKEMGGLQVDPETGRHMVWNRIMPEGEEGSTGLGGASHSTQPQMRMVLATPDQEASIQRAWGSTHQGQTMPKHTPMSREDRSFIGAQSRDPIAGPALAAAEKKYGRRLNADETLVVSTMAQEAHAARLGAEGTTPINRNFYGNSQEGVGWYPRLAANTGRAVLGLKPVERPELSNVWQAMQDDSQQSPLLNTAAPLAWPMAAYRAARNAWNKPTTPSAGRNFELP